MGRFKPRHGTTSRYKRYGCTCPQCRNAVRIQQSLARDRRVAELRADPSLREHGIESTYVNWGCHCTRCGEARREAQRRRAVEKRERASR